MDNGYLYCNSSSEGILVRYLLSICFVLENGKQRYLSVIQLVIIKLGYRTKTGGYRWKVSYYSIDLSGRSLHYKLWITVNLVLQPGFDFTTSLRR